MTAPTHVISGLSFTVAFTHATGICPTGVQLLALLVGTLAPDIDGEGSITRPGTILRRFIGRGLAELLDAVFKFLTRLIQLAFSHRGFLHSPLFAFSLFVLAFILQQPWITWFALGYSVHLLGDALTAGGIPVYSPVSSHRVSLSPMRTGSRAEFAIAALLLVFTCAFGWALLPNDVKDTHRKVYEFVVNGRPELHASTL